MMETVSISVFSLIAGGVFVTALFAATMAAAVYGVNKSNQEFYSRREDANQREIASLKEEVHQLKGQVAMLMGMIGGPKESAGTA